MFSLIEDKKRQRRRRTAFTDEQLDRLEEAFENEKFPGIQIREDLSRELNIKEDRIQVIQYKLFPFVFYGPVKLLSLVERQNSSSPKSTPPASF